MVAAANHHPPHSLHTGSGSKQRFCFTDMRDVSCRFRVDADTERYQSQSDCDAALCTQCFVHEMMAHVVHDRLHKCSHLSLLIQVQKLSQTCYGCTRAQVAAQLASEMKVKAVYKLLAGKMTAEAPHLETFLPPQLLQLIGRAVHLPSLHPTLAIAVAFGPGCT